MTNSTARWVCFDAGFVVPLVARLHEGSPFPQPRRGCGWLNEGESCQNRRICRILESLYVEECRMNAFVNQIGFVDSDNSAILMA